MPLFLNEKMIQEMREIQRTKSDKFLKIKHFHKLTLTVWLCLRGALCGTISCPPRTGNTTKTQEFRYPLTRHEI